MRNVTSSASWTKLSPLLSKARNACQQKEDKKSNQALQEYNKHAEKIIEYRITLNLIFMIQ